MIGYRVAAKTFSHNWTCGEQMPTVNRARGLRLQQLVTYTTITTSLFNNTDRSHRLRNISISNNSNNNNSNSNNNNSITLLMRWLDSCLRVKPTEQGAWRNINNITSNNNNNNNNITINNRYILIET